MAVPCIAAPSAKVQAEYGNLPLAFEANQGQTDPTVKFFAHGDGSGLFLTPDEIVLTFPASKSVLRMRFAGANRNPRMEGVSQLPGKINYLIGNEPSHWKQSVTSYSKVRYRDVYPGIDAVYYGRLRQLEYDLVVSPGADPRAIRLSFPGVESMKLDPNGDLVLSLPGGDVRQHKPVSYQWIGGRRQPVETRFVLRGNREASFELARFDHSRPVIIDPVYGYSTLLGGTGNEAANAVAVDSSGNAYIGGSTTSTDFPGTTGALQTAKTGTTTGFVAKLNAAGSALVYYTYLGGSKFSVVTSLAIDAGGNAYLTGRTSSVDFPVTPGAAQFTSRGGPSGLDAFIAKLNPAGSALVYSTYLGGSGDEFANGIVADAAGNAYVTGSTTSADFPKTDGALQPTSAGEADAFVSKVNPTGTALVYSTYLGGKLDDGALGIAVDDAGSVVVTGYTDSTDYPTTSGANQRAFGGQGDGFVTRLNAAGTTLVYSTLVGGNRADEGDWVVLDRSGNAYITGTTASRNFVTTPAAYQKTFRIPAGKDDDAFALKLDPAGAVVYSTLLGGSNDETGYFGAVDTAGNLFITGFTNSQDFPQSRPRQLYFGGGDAYLTKLDPTGSTVLDSTFVGGTLLDQGNAVALDSTGAAYVVGSSEAANFITTQGAFQNRLGGTRDAFITKFMYPPSQQISLHAVVNAANYRGGSVAPGEIVTIFGSPIGPEALTTLQLDSSGKVSTTLSETRILFDGVPAPLIYVSASQASAVVPYEVADKVRTEVQVEYRSVKSNPVLIAVAPATPAVFTANASGAGQGAILNQDGSVNSESNPAPQGSIVVIYAAGGGQTVPAGVTGAVTSGASKQVLPVRVEFGSSPVIIQGEVLYSGSAPGLVAGVLQINVKTPSGLNGKWPFRVRVGTALSTPVDLVFGNR